MVFQSARLWQGWLMADSMLIRGVETSSAMLRYSRSSRSSTRSRRSANALRPSASPYEAITGTASLTCSAAAPSITIPGRVSSPWMDISGEITNAPPPRRVMEA